MITANDFVARAQLYAREVKRRGRLLLFAEFLPLLLIAAALTLSGVFFTPFAYATLVFALAVFVLLIGNLALFCYMVWRELPAKIGLLCPHCRKFVLFHAAAKQARLDEGKCPQCGETVFVKS
ncbi:hypothetical protein FACS1894139_19420 [Planctomycetales bacterium]|nr:hypothetical protein FACS1894107_17350 [Planctomycetales bacterium]GHT09314.1 hypothetical protein FACS1894139_19420 [Planctomycetales bacterium]